LQALRGELQQCAELDGTDLSASSERRQPREARTLRRRGERQLHLQVLRQRIFVDPQHDGTNLSASPGWCQPGQTFARAVSLFHSYQLPTGEHGFMGLRHELLPLSKGIYIVYIEGDRRIRFMFSAWRSAIRYHLRGFMFRADCGCRRYREAALRAGGGFLRGGSSIPFRFPWVYHKNTRSAHSGRSFFMPMKKTPPANWSRKAWMRSPEQLTPECRRTCSRRGTRTCRRRALWSCRSGT